MSDEFDCADCGMCDNCIARTKTHFEEMERREKIESINSNLCAISNCPQCGAQCDHKEAHEGQHHCINCGCRWWDDDEDEE